MEFNHECFDCAFKHLSRALVFYRLRGTAIEDVEVGAELHDVDSLFVFALVLLQEMEEAEYRNVSHLAYFVGACSVLETVAWRVGDPDVRIALREVRNDVYSHVSSGDIEEEIIEKARNELIHLSQVVTYASHPIVDNFTNGIITADLLHVIEHLAGSELEEQHPDECRELGSASVSDSDIKAMLALVYEQISPDITEFEIL